MSDWAVARTRERMRALGLDAVLITSGANRRYLTGYTAEDHAPDESSGVVLVDAASVRLLTSANNTGWAAAEVNSDVVVEAWKRPWETFVATAVRELGFSRIGFENRALTVASHAQLANGDSGATWVGLDGHIDSLRVVKSAEEITQLESAIRYTDQVFAEVAASLAIGMTERQVAWQIERLTRESTPGTLAFSPGVGGGPNSARPHHAASDRPFGEGEPIIIDMGVAVNGYCGDLTRTLWLGEQPSRLREVYNVVHRANAAAIEAIAGGVSVKAVDQLTRDLIAEAGYGDYLVHSLGHGVGLRIHEGPSVSIHSDDLFAAGQVVTVEPGVYIPDWGGVRIEDVVLVTETGCKVLTASPK
jgi:Xaa-Pro aminopeptidase